jgi:hypothetical protein
MTQLCRLLGLRFLWSRRIGATHARIFKLFFKKKERKNDRGTNFLKKVAPGSVCAIGSGLGFFRQLRRLLLGRRQVRQKLALEFKIKSKSKNEILKNLKFKVFT